MAHDIVMAAAGNAGGPAEYVEDVFSTWLYDGNDSARSITNGIDLADKGGLVWIKPRVSSSHSLYDTNRGTGRYLVSNSTAAEVNTSAVAGPGFGLTSFNSNGFSLGSSYNSENGNNLAIASWTFRKAPKFFDVVTYTGNGTAGRTIAHNLGSVPGMIIVKKTNAAANWRVYHRSLTSADYFLNLNLTSAEAQATSIWNNTAPTSSVFSVGNETSVNNSGDTYVAYLFAHDAGGFGAAGTDNIISCGSWTAGSSGNVNINLGYEPQYLLIKRTDSTGNWIIVDNMRGLHNVNADTGFGVEARPLWANLTNAEGASGFIGITATGFNAAFSGGGTFIYMAIRRPMKTPTTGTEALALSTWTGSAGNKDMGTQTNNFGSGHLSILKQRSGTQTYGWFDNLRGRRPFLVSASTGVEVTDGGSDGGFSVVNNRLQLNSDSYFGAGGDGEGQSYIGWHLRRAPGFFDVVCYTGDNNYGRQINHNLGVVPEMIILKCRNNTIDGGGSGTFPSNWWTAIKGSGANGFWGMRLNQTNASSYTDSWADYFPNIAAKTAFNPYHIAIAADSAPVGNASGKTYVAYLFASCPGVSKVGSYTGNGTVGQTINCGFSAGARFVMIKRTDASGDWYVWDTARGIVSDIDPYVLLNSTAAENTSRDLLDPHSSGFIVNQQSLTNLNVSGATYIYLAIA